MDSLQPLRSDQQTLLRLGLDPGSLPNTTILMADGVVVYRSWGGLPSVNAVEDRTNPLGPLQDIGPVAATQAL